MTEVCDDGGKFADTLSSATQCKRCRQSMYCIRSRIVSSQAFDVPATRCQPMWSRDLLKGVRVVLQWRYNCCRPFTVSTHVANGHFEWVSCGSGNQWNTMQELCRQFMYCVRSGIVSSQTFVVPATRCQTMWPRDILNGCPVVLH